LAVAVSIPIHPITGRHSLSPTSYARPTWASLAVGLPCLVAGRRNGFTVFHLSNKNRLGSVYLPAVLVSL